MTHFERLAKELDMAVALTYLKSCDRDLQAIVVY